jgi:hypothetical protein
MAVFEYLRADCIAQKLDAGDLYRFLCISLGISCDAFWQVHHTAKPHADSSTHELPRFGPAFLPDPGATQTESGLGGRDPAARFVNLPDHMVST